MTTHTTKDRILVNVLHIGSASNKIKKILNEAGIQVHHSSADKLFQSYCTLKDSINKFQNPGVYCIPCECSLVYTGKTGQNFSCLYED